MKNRRQGKRRNASGKKLLCVVISALMFVTMFAGDVPWDLVKGDISINAGETEQIVTQVGGDTRADSAPVITSSAPTDNSVTISSEAGATAQVTIQDAVINTSGTESAVTVTAGSSAEITIQNVDISTDGNANAIDVAANSNATIIVDGTENNIDDNNRASGYGDSALIHVGDNASLTIQGDGSGESGENKLEVAGRHTHGAGIGSNNGEDFTGKVSITGDVYVKSGVLENGAAVGSGDQGKFAGVINVSDGAELRAETGRNNAAIGAGQGGDFTKNAQVNITDSTVKADTYNNGAAIGGGYMGNFAGTVTIENSDVTAVAGSFNPGGTNGTRGEAAAIGAGYNGNFSGEVSVIDSNLTAVALHDGAAIGAGGIDKTSQTAEFTEEGVVNIDNSTVVLETHSKGIPIGAPEENSIFNGTVNITGESEITLVDVLNKETGDQALIGANGTGNGSVLIEDSVQVNYWTGTHNQDAYVGFSDENKFDMAYRNSMDGVFTKADEAALKEIVKNAELTIRIVPKPTPAPTPSAPINNSGSTTVCISTAYDFWRTLEAKIRSCQRGDEITVNVADFNEMPCYILEALTECGVDLIIEWNGGEDIEIKHDHGIEYEHEQIAFTVLIELLKK
ncbi:MAG: hypothetical protein IJZ91_09140 [Oscillospiraceae bacterium]|nr:hypothetical protein [Oscillospiraceae bacterium]